MDPKPNLQKAVYAVHQSKAVKSQQATVSDVAKSSDDTIDVLQKGRHPKKGQGYKIASSSADIATNYQCTNEQLQLFSLWAITNASTTAMSSQRC